MLDAIASKTYRWLFDAATDAMLICNRAGDIAAANPAAQTLFQCAPEPLERLRLAALFAPLESGESASEAVLGPLDQPRAGVIVRTRICVEEHALLECSVSPLDENWTLISLHHAQPLQHAQHALREHQQRLATLIDASPDFIYFKDGAGRWQIANQAALELFQLGEIDYQGKTDAEIAALAQPCYRDALRYCTASDEAAWQNGTISRCTESVTSANGDTRHADVYKIPLFQPDGQRKALVILGRDITDLEQARADLKASEQFLSELLEAAPDCIIYKDPDGRYRFANSATVNTLRIDPGRLLGKTDAELATELPPAWHDTLRECANADAHAWTLRHPIHTIETVTTNAVARHQIEFVRTPLFHPDGARKGLLLFGRDVTDKLESERIKDENEALIRRLIDASPDFILFRDAADRWRYANQALLRFLGLTDLDYRGKSDAELRPHVDLQLHARFAAAAEVRARAWETGAPARAIHRFEMPDGTIAFIDFSYVPYFERDGRRYGSVGIARDVSEQKRIEDALRFSEQRLTQALWATELGTWDWNIERGEITVNPRWQAMLGHRCDEPAVAIERWRQLIHPEDAVDARAALEAHLAGRSEQFVHEMRMLTNVGEWRWVITSGKVIARAPDGAARRVVGTQQDIHARKLAERTLIEGRERLACAITGGDLGTWDWDLKSQTLRYDDDWLRSLGYAPGEVGCSLDDCQLLCHPDDYGRFQDAWDHYVHGLSEFYQVELRLRTRGGDWNWYLSSGRVTERDRDGNPLRASGIFMDINRRKYAEWALREQRQELERLIKREVASLTASAIAHELNQPLNAVAGYSDAALRMLENGNPRPERLEHALRQSSQQAQRAGQTMRELLTLLHDGETETAPLDLNDFIHQVVGTLRSDGILADHSLICDLDPRAATVVANRIQIEKVLYNLIGNSVDAMRAAGMVHGQIRICSRDHGDRIEVSVRDTGPGLDPGATVTLFEPFHTTKPGGLGMGLAVSRSMIRAHGGELWLGAPEYGGAEFHFTLPYPP
ncbi:MAG: PAS domain-containing protein [Thiotrichales bacterium]